MWLHSAGRLAGGWVHLELGMVKHLSFPIVSVPLSFQMDFPCDFSSRVADLFTQ